MAYLSRALAALAVGVAALAVWAVAQTVPVHQRNLTNYAGNAVINTSRLRRCFSLPGAPQPTPPPDPAPNPFRNDYKNSDYCGFSPTGCGELAQQLLSMEVYGRNDPIPLAILVTVNGTTNTTTDIASYYPKVDQFTLLDIPNSALSGRGYEQGDVCPNTIRGALLLANAAVGQRATLA